MFRQNITYTDVIETYDLKLYKEQPKSSTQERLLRNIVNLSKEHKETLQRQDREEKELGKLRSGKSPGVNGITTDFNDFSLAGINDIFMGVFSKISSKEQLSETQRVSTVQIIQEKGDPTEMK